MAYILFAAYNLLTPLLALAYLIFFVLSPRRRLLKNFFAELRERLSLNSHHSPFVPRCSPIWMHAASVGEVKALTTFIPYILALPGGHGLLITTSTWAGRNEALKLSPYARLAPLDLYPLTKAFVERTSPRALILVETEIWPNMLFCAGKAGIPVFMINARVSAGTFKLYSFLRPLARLIMEPIRCIMAQTEADAARFSALAGAGTGVVFTGNLKYDLLKPDLTRAGLVKSFIAQAGWQDGKILVAGSTHPEEDRVILDAWVEAKKTEPGLKLIIVPRHMERLHETETALRRHGAAFSRWSQEAAEGADCLLVDAMGLLQALYAVSTVCFVGGTLDDTGGHNLLEPSMFAKPVLFGPNFKNAEHAGRSLLGFRGGFMVGDAVEFKARLCALLEDPALLRRTGENSLKALQSVQGATAATLSAISPFLNRSRPPAEKPRPAGF